MIAVAWLTAQKPFPEERPRKAGGLSGAPRRPAKQKPHRWPALGRLPRYQLGHTGSSNRTAARAIIRPLGRRFAFRVSFAISVAKFPKRCHLFERGRMPRYY
jgi:hypothetical protein